MSHDYVRVRYRGESGDGTGEWSGEATLAGVGAVAGVARLWLSYGTHDRIAIRWTTDAPAIDVPRIHCLRRNVRFYDRAGKRLAARDIAGGGG